MCCCETHPNINGEPGYSWDGKHVGIRPVDPPALAEGDTLLYDEPGRCGGIDSHCLHLRVVKARFGWHHLLARHGAGDERIELCCSFDLVVKAGTLDGLDTHARYWLLASLYMAARDAADAARDKERGHWRKAAAEKRIKTRKQRGSDQVKVWIE